MKRELSLKIAELTAELENLKVSGSDSAEKLEDIISKLQDILVKEENGEHYDGISEKISEAVYLFETTHPDLAEVLSRVLSLFGAMGI